MVRLWYPKESADRAREYSFLRPRDGDGGDSLGARMGYTMNPAGHV